MKTNGNAKHSWTWTKAVACAVALALTVGLAPVPAMADIAAAQAGALGAGETGLAVNPDGKYLWTWFLKSSTKWDVAGQSVRCRVNFNDNDSWVFLNGPKYRDASGKKVKYKARFKFDCTHVHGLVTWKSSDPKVASVSQSGVVTTHGKGKMRKGACKTTITASTVVGGVTVSDDFPLTVNDPKLKKQKLKVKGNYVTIKKSRLEKGPVKVKIRGIVGNKTKLTYRDRHPGSDVKFDGNKGVVIIDKNTEFDKVETSYEKRIFDLVATAKQTSKYRKASKRFGLAIRLV